MARYALSLLFLCVTSLLAQYPFNTPSEEDTLQAPADSPRVEKPATPPSPPTDPIPQLKADALKWVRRLIYRGFLDEASTRVSATYALTDWTETSGPNGPVKAHLSIAYLGSVSWLGQPAAWLQASFRSFDEDRPTVDFDIVIESGDKFGEAYRVLTRVNREEFTAASFTLAQGQFDYEREDAPRSGEATQLKLFSGSYPVTPYRGSGADGAKVIAYRTDDIPPLNIVRLAYGNECLSLRDRGVDVEPKFEVPLPTVR
ncbi:hypothetical protein IT157_06165 [bacterium]|nr:hypothetical protein [bacterium]